MRVEGVRFSFWGFGSKGGVPLHVRVVLRAHPHLMRLALGFSYGCVIGWGLITYRTYRQIINWEVMESLSSYHCLREKGTTYKGLDKHARIWP